MLLSMSLPYLLVASNLHYGVTAVSRLLLHYTNYFQYVTKYQISKSNLLHVMPPIMANYIRFLADHTNGRAYATVLRLSVVRRRL